MVCSWSLSAGEMAVVVQAPAFCHDVEYQITFKPVQLWVYLYDSNSLGQFRILDLCMNSPKMCGRYSLGVVGSTKVVQKCVRAHQYI